MTPLSTEYVWPLAVCLAKQVDLSTVTVHDRSEN
jgi:hypothetical protein